MTKDYNQRWNPLPFDSIRRTISSESTGTDKAIGSFAEDELRQIRGKRSATSHGVELTDYQAERVGNYVKALESGETVSPSVLAGYGDAISTMNPSKIQQVGDFVDAVEKRRRAVTQQNQK